MRRALLATAVAAALMASGTATASAAPQEEETIKIACEGGETFEVDVNGNGAFTPGRLLGSTRVLIPVTFGNFVFTAVLPDGTEITEAVPGEDSKGGGNVAARNPRAAVECIFSASFTLPEDDPEMQLPAGTVVSFSGELTGFLTGRS